MQARNNADQLVYSAEKNIEDFKDKVTTEIIDNIKAAIAECVLPTIMGNSTDRPNLNCSIEFLGQLPQQGFCTLAVLGRTALQ